MFSSVGKLGPSVLRGCPSGNIKDLASGNRLSDLTLNRKYKSAWKDHDYPESLTN